MGPRVARSAAQRHRQRGAHRVRYRARIAGIVALVLALIIGYVGLTAQLAAQSYRLSADQARQTKLLQASDALSQALAQLQSLPSLEQAAKRLHMSQPRRVVVIAVPETARATRPPTLAARITDFIRSLKRE